MIKDFKDIPKAFVGKRLDQDTGLRARCMLLQNDISTHTTSDDIVHWDSRCNSIWELVRTSLLPTGLSSDVFRLLFSWAALPLLVGAVLASHQAESLLWASHTLGTTLAASWIFPYPWGLALSHPLSALRAVLVCSLAPNVLGAF